MQGRCTVAFGFQDFLMPRSASDLSNNSRPAIWRTGRWRRFVNNLGKPWWEIQKPVCKTVFFSTNNYNFWTCSHQNRTVVVIPNDNSAIAGLAVPTVTRLALWVAPPWQRKVTFVTGQLSRIINVLWVVQVHAEFGDGFIIWVKLKNGEQLNHIRCVWFCEAGQLLRTKNRKKTLNLSV